MNNSSLHLANWQHRSRCNVTGDNRNIGKREKVDSPRSLLCPVHCSVRSEAYTSSLGDKGYRWSMFFCEGVVLWYVHDEIRCITRPMLTVNSMRTLVFMDVLEWSIRCDADSVHSDAKPVCRWLVSLRQGIHLSLKDSPAHCGQQR